MLQVCRDPNFGEEPLGTEHGAKVRIQDLESDAPSMSNVAGEIDNGHPTTSDLALNLVAAGEDDHRVGNLMRPSMPRGVAESYRESGAGAGDVRRTRAITGKWSLGNWLPRA